MSHEKIIHSGFTVPLLPLSDRRVLRLGQRATLLKIYGTLATWFARWKQRRALSRLDDRLLADIGVTRTQAKHEADKPFWRD